MKLPNLTPRLQKIYDIVPPCGSIADIGTDHAYIPVCLTLSKKCQRAIASDIKEGPVLRAKSTVLAYGAEDLVDVRQGSGLETIKSGEADAIIIAGMGGLLIANILSAAEETAKSAKLLILQPMTAAKELREFLIGGGYEILKEYLVFEEEKLYNIISARPGISRPYTKAEIFMGADFEDEAIYAVYRRRRMEKIQKQIDGLSKSDFPENKKRLKELIELKEMIENENL